MTLLKNLEQRIRGWLPQEPALPRKASPPNSPNKKTPRTLFTQTPLGLKIVVGLLWVFGVGAILALSQQTAQLGYLPFDLRFVMAAVAVVDGAGLFVVGAGLLTNQKRWINIAIVFLAASLVVFYVLPLRAAWPLEIVLISYLVILREGKTPQAVKAVPAALLLAVLCVATFASATALVHAQTINPSKTLVQNHTQTSNNSGFVVTTNVYQYSDLDPKKDYYYLEITLRCPETNFNCAVVNVSTNAPNESTKNGWLPHSNPAAPFAIGLGIATLYIGNPETIQTNYDTKTNISWAESTLNPQKTKTFSTDLWVPQDAHFAINVAVEAGFADPVFGNLWRDQLEVGGVEV